MCLWKNWSEFALKIGNLSLDFDIMPEHTALLPVDLQYFCASPDHGLGVFYKERTPDMWKYWSSNITQRVIPNNERLLSFFRKHKLRIVHVHRGCMLPDGADELPSLQRKYAEIESETGKRPAWFPIGSLEQEAMPSVAPLGGELKVVKTSNGAFATTGLDALLRHLGIGTLIITGVATNVCVESTAREAVDLGYNVALVDDACGGHDPILHDVTMIVFSTRLGRVMTTDEVLTELSTRLN